MSRNSLGPRTSCRFRLSRSSAGSDMSSRTSISRAASFKAVRAASVGGRRRLLRWRLFRRCLAKAFSISEVSERRSWAAAFSAASFRLASIRNVICAVFLWRIYRLSLVLRNSTPQQGSLFAHSEAAGSRKRCLLTSVTERKVDSHQRRSLKDFSYSS
jgi:hypothetical protein